MITTPARLTAALAAIVAAAGVAAPSAFAKHGADDPAGQHREHRAHAARHGADDPAGHDRGDVRHGNDDGPAHR